MFAVLPTKMDLTSGCGHSPSISPALRPPISTPPPLIPMVKIERDPDSFTKESVGDDLTTSSCRTQPTERIDVTARSESNIDQLQQTMNMYWQSIIDARTEAEKENNSTQMAAENITDDSQMLRGKQNEEHQGFSLISQSTQRIKFPEVCNTQSESIASTPTLPQDVSLQQLSNLSQQILAAMVSLQRLQQSNAVSSLGNLLPPPPNLIPLDQQKYSPIVFPSKPPATVQRLHDPSSETHHSTNKSCQSSKDTNNSDDDDLPLDLSLPVSKKTIPQHVISPSSSTSSSSKRKLYDANSIASIRSNFPTLLNSRSSNLTQPTSQRVVESSSHPFNAAEVSSNSSIENQWPTNAVQSNSQEIPQTDASQLQLQKWILAAMSVQRMQQIALGRSNLLQNQVSNQDFSVPAARNRKMNDSYQLPQPNRRLSNAKINENGEKSKYARIQRSPNTDIINTGRASGSPSSKTSTHASSDSDHSQTGKRYRRYAKPPYSYVSLITLSILSSREKKLRLSQILKRISEMFPFFNGSYQGWRDSVRHNLSQNECFVKVLKNPYRPTAKGNFWTVNLNSIPHELLLRQNTLVSRYAQDSGYRYRKDLTEVFDLRTGALKVPVPCHLLKDADDPKESMLTEDAAALMEAILLEETNDDDLNDIRDKIPPEVRQFTLVDLFRQSEDKEEESALGSGRSRARNKQSVSVASVVPSTFPPQTTIQSRHYRIPESATVQGSNSSGYLHRLALAKDSYNNELLYSPFVNANPNPFAASQTAVLAKALASQMPGISIAEKLIQQNHDLPTSDASREIIQSCLVSKEHSPLLEGRGDYEPSPKKSKRKGAQPTRHPDLTIQRNATEGYFQANVYNTINQDSPKATTPSGFDEPFENSSTTQEKIRYDSQFYDGSVQTSHM